MVEVPGMNFLMMDGKSAPNTSPNYQQAIDALYSLAYGVKFALKPQGYDHIVPPLEGLWWVNDTTEFTVANKQRWEWMMMIMQPKWVLPECIEQVREMTSRKSRMNCSPKSDLNIITKVWHSRSCTRVLIRMKPQ
jgi:hypothetical protein